MAKGKNIHSENQQLELIEKEISQMINTLKTKGKIKLQKEVASIIGEDPGTISRSQNRGRGDRLTLSKAAQIKQKILEAFGGSIQKNGIIDFDDSIPSQEHKISRVENNPLPKYLLDTWWRIYNRSPITRDIHLHLMHIHPKNVDDSVPVTSYLAGESDAREKCTGYACTDESGNFIIINQVAGEQKRRHIHIKIKNENSCLSELMWGQVNLISDNANVISYVNIFQYIGAQKPDNLAAKRYKYGSDAYHQLSEGLKWYFLSAQRSYLKMPQDGFNDMSIFELSVKKWKKDQFGESYEEVFQDMQPIQPYFKNTTWQFYLKDVDDTIDENILRISDVSTGVLTKITLVTPTKEYLDYEGFCRMSEDKMYLIANLNTRYREKELHLKIKRGRGTAPLVMTGQINYLMTDEEGVRTDNIILEKIDDPNIMPRKHLKGDYSKLPPVLVEYFSQSFSFHLTSVPTMINTWDELKSWIQKEEQKKEAMFASSEKITMSQPQSLDIEQNRLQRLVGKYNIYWAKMQNSLVRMSGVIEVFATGHTIFETKDETFEGRAVYKSGFLYLNFENDTENFYFMFDVGISLNPNLLQHIPGTIMDIESRSKFLYSTYALLCSVEKQDRDRIDLYFQYIFSKPTVEMDGNIKLILDTGIPIGDPSIQNIFQKNIIKCPLQGKWDCIGKFKKDQVKNDQIRIGKLEIRGSNDLTFTGVGFSNYPNGEVVITSNDLYIYLRSKKKHAVIVAYLGYVAEENIKEISANFLTVHPYETGTTVTGTYYLIRETSNLYKDSPIGEYDSNHEIYEYYNQKVLGTDLEYHSQKTFVRL